MNLLKKPLQIINWIINSKIRIGISVILIIVLATFGYQNLVKSQTSQPQYQTSQAERGSLTTSVTASGKVSQASGATITTQATGIVKAVYVKDGDIVTVGQKIAEITLDTASLQKQTAAWAAYLSAQNSLASAQNSLNSLNSAMWQSQQNLINDAAARGLATDNPTYIQENSDWLKAETDYKNQQNVIAASKTSLSSSWLSYSQLSPTITAPLSGKISGLSLTPGMTIQGTSLTNSTSSSTSLGTITITGSMPQAMVNLTEIDVVKVKPKQKVVLTLDALPNISFTGVVTVVNTNGSVATNVTTYPTTITFDTTITTIYPNMAVNATIITDVKNDVILVPSAAVQTNNSSSSVMVMRDGAVSSVPVEIGGSNDTSTEIVSGINEGETVVTGQISNTTGSTNTTTSPFGTTRGGFGSTSGFGGAAGGIRR